VIVVFGAGGDRDASKRPVMGRVASQLADTVVVTSDNPRSEPPLSIIDQVVSGAEVPPLVEPDRAQAIARALHLAASGDVVLVAGKGHETGQDFGTHVEAFDDSEVVRAALAATFDRSGPAVGPANGRRGGR
jgi:UDP-N-acetylmuramoyl-L-alanyl-D-glutamate--2,6-diaminopimelate ligase